MIDSRIKLTILEDNASSFTDHSNNLTDYQRDTVTLAMASVTDYLYVGFHKQINAMYAEVITANSASVLTLEIWDGTTWVEIEHQDESRGMTRSGFITWERQDDTTATSVNSESATWVRLSYDNGNTADIQGLNLVFSDDQACLTEFPQILDPRILGTGKTSNIIQHVAARNFIIQTLRNEGYIKQISSNLPENITQWDLLDIFEIREAAMYLALSKIFFVLSDEFGDNWWTKHESYNKLFKQTFTTAKLSIDTNDDGIEDVNEKLAPRKSMRFSR